MPGCGRAATSALTEVEDFALRSLGVDILPLALRSEVGGTGNPSELRSAGLLLMLESRMDRLTSLVTVANLSRTEEGTSSWSLESEVMFITCTHKKIIKLHVNVLGRIVDTERIPQRCFATLIVTVAMGATITGRIRVREARPRGCARNIGQRKARGVHGRPLLLGGLTLFGKRGEERLFGRSSCA